jgi:hypothetical protein
MNDNGAEIKKACANCRNALNISIDRDGHLVKTRYVDGMGYCSKHEGTSFLPRKMPDYSLPEPECWEESHT